MADYINIKGSTIQSLDSDPANPIVGQVWYNSTTQILKGTIAGGATIGTWSSGGALNDSREALGSAGTQTASLAFGGSSPTASANTEAYNGSSWTEVNNLNTARAASAMAGAQTAAAMWRRSYRYK